MSIASWRPGRIAVLAVFATLCGVDAIGATISLRDPPGVSAAIDVAEGRCADTVRVAVRAPRTDNLSAGSGALTKVVAWARIEVETACPGATAIEVIGSVDGRQVYRGLASRADGWVLVAVPQPPAPAAQLPCDELAAHPDDPQAKARGIADAALDAAAAIRACQEAARADPHSARLRFQLARGYLKADRVDDAVEQLVAAAEKGHGAALAYLADLHLDGVPGIEADPVLARSLYERSAAAGFRPAAAILAEFEDHTEAFESAEAAERAAGGAPAGGSATSADTASLKPYSMANVVENIDAHRFDDIFYDEIWVKHYLVEMADNIRSICESHFDERDIGQLRAEAEADHYRLGRALAGAAFLGAMATLADAMKNPNALLQNQGATTEEPFEAAMNDTEALFQRHLCDTPGLARFSANLRAFVSNAEAPLPQPEAIYAACLRDPAPSRYPASQFCSCFAGGLGQARVSQKHRKNLVREFRATAVEMMSLERNRGQFRACTTGF